MDIYGYMCLHVCVCVWGEGGGGNVVVFTWMDV